MATFTFDKSLGSLTIKRQHLFDTKTAVYSLEQIIEIIVRDVPLEDDLFAPLSLQLTSGKVVDIYWDTNFSKWREKSATTANLICNFLDLPYEKKWPQMQP